MLKVCRECGKEAGRSKKGTGGNGLNFTIGPNGPICRKCLIKINTE